MTSVKKTVDLVCDDLQRRQEFGVKKYGVALDATTNENMLQHLYEELLDSCMYIRTLIEKHRASETLYKKVAEEFFK